VKRFPVGLTLAAAIGLAVLLGLGAWQLKRLAWKQDLLARIAALQHAPARPLAEVLSSAARGEDVAYVRAATKCEPAAGAAPATYRYALRNGQVGWRAMAFCPLAGGPWSGIVLDRGLVDRFAGQMAPAEQAFPTPAKIVGVIRSPGTRGPLDVPPTRSADGAWVLQAVDPAALSLIAGPAARPAPYYLAVESESPPPFGVTPSALPQDIPNNHFVYALTWFGLAGVLASIWASYVWRRMHAP
jgi:surfeit locus 1 family protein